MSAPDITEVFYEQRAEYRDNADDDRGGAETHGALVVDTRRQLRGAQEREGTHEYEANAQQCPADAHDGLISMDA